jgi:hypothetical protein
VRIELACHGDGCERAGVVDEFRHVVQFAASVVGGELLRGAGKRSAGLPGGEFQGLEDTDEVFGAALRVLGDTLLQVIGGSVPVPGVDQQRQGVVHRRGTSFSGHLGSQVVEGGAAALRFGQTPHALSTRPARRALHTSGNHLSASLPGCYARRRHGRPCAEPGWWPPAVSGVGRAPRARAGAEVGAFALAAEQDEALGRLVARGAEPVRHAGVELGRLTGGEDQVPLAEDEP